MTTRQILTNKSAAFAMASLLSLLGTITGAGAASAATQSGSAHVESIGNLGAKVVPAVARRQATRADAKIRSAKFVQLMNIAPSPSFAPTCSTAAISSACVGLEIDSINSARAIEGLATTHVNLSNFASLTGPEQLLATTNLERIARGLPPVVALTAQLNTAAAEGASSSSDPALNDWTLSGDKSVLGWASNWAGGLNVLEADYLWMYDDGVGYNVDCPNAKAHGCWGHENNVLVTRPSNTSCQSSGGKPELLMGAALNPTGYHGATGIAEILVQSCGGLPTDTTVTWQMVRHALRTGALR